MLNRLRSAIFAVGYTIATIIYGSMVIVLIFFPRLWRHRILISWCWFIIQWLRLVCGIRYRILGSEQIPARRQGEPVIVLSKHQSTWETLALQFLFWPAATILKRELLRIPFFGWGLGCLSPIAIDRDNPREALRQVKQQGLERLSDGLNLLLFPEGTRMPVGTRGKYARSGAEIAVASGRPVIPVAVHAGHCWPVEGWIKKPGLVTVVIGEPIQSVGKSSRELIAEVEGWIENQQQKIDPAASEQSDDLQDATVGAEAGQRRQLSGAGKGSGNAQS